LLRRTLENIGEGLSVFDRKGRLIVWNCHFGDLLELPPNLTVGAPARDILMHQAMRGDFGDCDPDAEVARRVEAFFRDVPMVRERTTRGGILQICRRTRHNRPRSPPHQADGANGGGVIPRRYFAAYTAASGRNTRNSKMPGRDQRGDDRPALISAFSKP
jgi:hypothetical protein